VKKLIIALCWIALILDCRGEEMDASSIKRLVQQMDDSLARGHIYHINYSVIDKRTDAFYLHKQELIKLIESGFKNEEKNRSGVEPTSRQQNLLAIEKSFKRELSYTKTFNYNLDYTIDGIGFYLKRDISFSEPLEGKIVNPDTTIYASDGKIMGTFHLNDSHAVIQPATERPQIPEPYWTEVAYFFALNKISERVEGMSELKAIQTDNELVITGEKPGPGKSLYQLELKIDKTNMRPLQIADIYHNSLGQLHSKMVKTWQFGDFNGISLPKIVVDQTYETDLSGKLNLEQERTFTINDFSPEVKSTKESFKGLFKSSFSIWDEITGANYISGNPEDMLNKLSR
jgi:hypothetical protein